MYTKAMVSKWLLIAHRHRRQNKRRTIFALSVNDGLLSTPLLLERAPLDQSEGHVL
jgi:hypothetical protein